LPAKRSAVPELTQIADIKLNTQVSLWPTHAAIRLPWRTAQAMSASFAFFGLSWERYGSRSCVFRKSQSGLAIEWKERLDQLKAEFAKGECVMRIIAVAVVVLLWPAVAHASKDCMTKAEARKVYRISHLYWHGKGHCWDASPRVSHRQPKVGAVRRHRVEGLHKAKAKPKPEVKAEVVASSLVPTRANRTLTPEDLRTWANSMAAMTAEPIVTILDRWPHEELPQHRAKPTAVEEPSLTNTRTIVLVIIMFMALLALLIEVTVHRRPSYRKVP
jgi:hypothetical protein